MDTRFDPIQSLLQHVEGKAWTVNYHQQLLGRDDELSAHQANVSAPFQQYRMIFGMELKVTQALVPEQDEESKRMILTGSATTFPSFIPNAGDMFTADIGDGREGLFGILKSEKKTHLKETQYLIQYQLKGYIDEAESGYGQLVDKTVEETHFVKDYLNFGQNPLVLSADFNARIEFTKIFNELVDYYMHENFSLTYQTLIVPNQQFPTYDPFLARFIPNVISQRDHTNVGRIRTPSVDQHLAAHYPSIWDVMLEPNIRKVANLVHRARLLDTSMFKMQPLISGIFYTGIARVVFPFDVQTDVDRTYSYLPRIIGDTLMAHGKQRWDDLERLASLDPVPEPIPGELPDYLLVTADDFYVFSESFYVDRRPASKLEHLVLTYLREEALDKTTLLTLAQRSTEWGNLERFYYIPILLTMILATQRRN